MPPRVILHEISGNRSGKELSPHIHGEIIGYHKAGWGYRRISAELEVPKSTVHYTIKNHPFQTDGASQPRIGRPKKLVERDRRALFLAIRHEPKITYTKLQANTALEISQPTFYRELKDASITNQPAARRPFLLPRHAEERLAWAMARRNWTREQWDRVIWSNECTAEQGKGKRREWVFHFPSEKWDTDKIQTYKTGKEVKVMVWGAFCGTRRTRIIQMPLDPTSARGGVTSRSYIEVLNENLVDFYEEGLIFMQDGTSIHTAHIVRNWMREHGVECSPWPAYSPDLNPIEHVWNKMKELVYIQHPDLLQLPRNLTTTKDTLFEAIEDAWGAIPDEYFTALVDSMPRRVEAVIAANGYQTKY